jgi:hypothetical protein
MNIQTLTSFLKLPPVQAALTKEAQFFRELSVQLATFKTRLKPFLDNLEKGDSRRNTFASQLTTFRKGIDSAILDPSSLEKLNKVLMLGQTFMLNMKRDYSSVIGKTKLNGLLSAINGKLSGLKKQLKK